MYNAYTQQQYALYISNNITLQYNLILSISTLTYILSLLLLPLMNINTHIQCSSLLLQNNNANTQKRQDTPYWQ